MKVLAEGQFTDFFRTPPLKSQEKSKRQKSQITEKLLKNHRKKSQKSQKKNHVISKSQNHVRYFEK